MIFQKKLLQLMLDIIEVMVSSSDGDTDFFDIVTGVLQRDKLVLFLFITCLDCILQTSIDLIKENGLMLKTARSKQQKLSLM